MEPVKFAVNFAWNALKRKSSLDKISRTLHDKFHGTPLNVLSQTSPNDSPQLL